MGTITTFPPIAPTIPVSGTHLAYAQRVTDLSSAGAETDIPELTATVVVPEGRRLLITAVGLMTTTANYANGGLRIKEGATKLGEDTASTETGGDAIGLVATAVISPTAGVHTYKVSAFTKAGGGFIVRGATVPAYLLIEDITNTPKPYPAASVPVGQLAYAQITANWGGGTTTLTDVPGLSVNISVPAGRVLRISSFVAAFYGFSAARYVEMQILEGATTLQLAQSASVAGQPESLVCDVVLSPSAGSHTYKLAVKTNSGTFSLGASTGWPAYIMVEDITPTPAPANSAPSSTLGYAEVTANQGSIGATATDITGLSVTVTVPAGRRLRISSRVYYTSTTSDGDGFTGIFEGATQLQESRGYVGGTTAPWAADTTVIISPSAGAHTYKLVGKRVTGSGTLTSNANVQFPAYILVEDITAVSTYAINPLAVQPGTFQTGDYIWPAGSSVWGQGAPGTNFDWLKISKTGTVSASNILYAFSHRSNDTDLWLYGYNGSSFGVGSFFIQPYLQVAQGMTVAGDIVANGAGYQQFAGTLSGASISALKTVGIQCNGIVTGFNGSGTTLRAKNQSNNIQFDWNGGFQMWVDVTNVKTFVIPHPTDDERYLVHACIEGPEAAVIYRGQAQLQNGWCEIKLPDYFEALCAEEGRSVMLTCIADDPVDEWCPVLHATYPRNGKFWVGLGSGMVINDQRFWWEVKAVRKDVPPLNVAPLKRAVDVLGSGPYTYAKEK